MYPLPPEPSAIEIIRRSATCHPSMFLEALERIAADDIEYSAKRPALRSFIMSHAAAALRAADYVKRGRSENFGKDMGAGVIALKVACHLQCLSPDFHAEAAIRTWNE